MTATETKAAMAKIALDAAAKYGEKGAALDKSAKTERAALAIAKHSAETCAAQLEIDHKDRWFTRTITVFGKAYHGFDEYKPVYETLSGDDRESFEMFVFAAVFVRDGVEQADEKLESDEIDAQTRFRFGIQRSVDTEILTAWQEFWNRRGCVPCEVVR